MVYGMVCVCDAGGGGGGCDVDDCVIVASRVRRPCGARYLVCPAPLRGLEIFRELVRYYRPSGDSPLFLSLARGEQIGGNSTNQSLVLVTDPF
jgi:hypothetical protein